MEEDRIFKVLSALHDIIDNSFLKVNEKNILKTLLEKIYTYYQEQCNEIEKYQVDICTYTRKRAILTSQVTDYIVSINDAIKGKNNISCIANIIYKEINYDDKKGKFKRKRLIK